MFGLPESRTLGHGADARRIVHQVVRALREAALDLVIKTDVCLCEYTDHGHCGLLEGEEIVNDASLERPPPWRGQHAGADCGPPT